MIIAAGIWIITEIFIIAIGIWITAEIFIAADI
jgi:hypothetical protein